VVWMAMCLFTGCSNLLYVEHQHQQDERKEGRIKAP